MPSPHVGLRHYLARDWLPHNAPIWQSDSIMQQEPPQAPGQASKSSGSRGSFRLPRHNRNCAPGWESLQYSRHLDSISELGDSIWLKLQTYQSVLQGTATSLFPREQWKCPWISQLRASGWQRPAVRSWTSRWKGPAQSMSPARGQCSLVIDRPQTSLRPGLLHTSMLVPAQEQGRLCAAKALGQIGSGPTTPRLSLAHVVQ